jgi:hypothetical protein
MKFKELQFSSCKPLDHLRKHVKSTQTSVRQVPSPVVAISI